MTDPTADPLSPSEVASQAAPIPALPGYEILGLLGRGGMGVVYQARHLALERTVALKMILAADQAVRGTPAFQDRGGGRGPTAAPAHRPGLRGGRAPGAPYLALEFVAGGSLAQKLAGPPLPVREAARLVQALALALHLAHSRNVIHRDLKPANVLLTEDGVPKVTDFGLARQLDSDRGQTQTGAIMGTPSYMAPEQADGRTQAAGPAADVYALGAVLYECLTGRPPFRGATVLETLDQVRRQEPVPPRQVRPQCPRDLETICLKCLRKQPEQRYASARELADDLGRFQRGEPVAARPVGTLGRLVRWMRRRPAVAGLLAAVVLLALGGGGIATELWWQAREALVQTAQAEAFRAREERRLSDKKREDEEDSWAGGFSSRWPSRTMSSTKSNRTPCGSWPWTGTSASGSASSSWVWSAPTARRGWDGMRSGWCRQAWGWTRGAGKRCWPWCGRAWMTPRRRRRSGRRVWNWAWPWGRQMRLFGGRLGRCWRRAWPSTPTCPRWNARREP